MPTNPEQLHAAIHRIGNGLVRARRTSEAAQGAALGMLHEAGIDPKRLIAVIEEAASADASLRCAIPTDEAPSVGYLGPAGIVAPAILAADGSQVSPDRHAEALFAVVNIGSVLMQPGSNKPPELHVDTEVLFGDELYSPDGQILSEGDLALRRDAAERRHILKHLPSMSGVVALGDGPLELWGAKEVSDSRAFERALHQYLDDLRELERRGCLLAGYVDKPAAGLVVRMLEVTQASLGAGDSPKSLRGASDRALFARILEPGQRSSIFALQSSSRTRYAGDLAIHFFYLNLGRDTLPALARVELPAWVARDRERVETLHASLLAQASVMGARPYPYILHRAHETARITPAETEQIKLRLLLEMRMHGMEPESISPKSSAKSLKGMKGG